AFRGGAVLEDGDRVGDFVEDAPGEAAAEAAAGDEVAAAVSRFEIGMGEAGAFELGPGGPAGRLQVRRSRVTDGGIVMAEVFDPPAVLPVPRGDGHQDRYGEHCPHRCASRFPLPQRTYALFITTGTEARARRDFQGRSRSASSGGSIAPRLTASRA